MYENNVLPAFIRARQISIYPPMIKKVISDNKQLVTDNDASMYKKAAEDTTKIDTMIKFIKERKDNQNKKIIFCFFKQEIDYILCQLNIINATAKVIDGRTSTTNKKKIIAGVPDILILQIQTSCEGLNLQDYSEIYFTSPHWNPAVESQAIARAHRIGQNKDVHVFKFIHINFVKSIEQHILSIQQHKCDIAKKIL
jgi:SNF2 family DNA or RNA helicase